MIAGTFAYGPMDRIFGTRKWIIFIGSSICVTALVGLALAEQITFGISVSLFCVLGFFGMSYPLMIAHGRSFSPEHLTGRCVTLLNMFAIGGAGIFQFTESGAQDFCKRVKPNNIIDIAFGAISLLTLSAAAKRY